MHLRRGCKAEYYLCKALKIVDGSLVHTCKGVWGYAPWGNVRI